MFAVVDASSYLIRGWRAFGLDVHQTSVEGLTSIHSKRFERDGAQLSVRFLIRSFAGTTRRGFLGGMPTREDNWERGADVEYPETVPDAGYPQTRASLMCGLCVGYRRSKMDGYDGEESSTQVTYAFSMFALVRQEPHDSAAVLPFVCGCLHQLL